MKIIRGQPATGKPPKIICSGCGKKALEAGVAVPDTAAEEGRVYGSSEIVFEGVPVSASWVSMSIDQDQMQPLCEDCLAALERGA